VLRWVAVYWRGHDWQIYVSCSVLQCIAV